MTSVKEKIQNGLAGGSCACVAVGVFNSLDTLKIRWQVTPQSTYANIIAFSKDVIKTEGFVRGLWTPGLIANSSSILISSSTRMGLYPVFRDRIVGDGEKKKIHMFVAGLLPGAIGYFCGTPLYQVKNRLQAEAGKVVNGELVSGVRAGYAPTYTGTVNCFLSILRNEGVPQLWRGGLPLVFRGAAITSGQFLGYDGTKTEFRKHGITEGPILHVASAVAAAFCCATFSCPFDIVMNRWQNAKMMGKQYSGVSECVMDMVRSEGPMVFYRGWTPFFTRLAPVLTLYMPLYEQVRKHVFGLGYFK